MPNEHCYVRRYRAMWPPLGAVAGELNYVYHNYTHVGHRVSTR